MGGTQQSLSRGPVTLGGVACAVAGVVLLGVVALVGGVDVLNGLSEAAGPAGTPPRSPAAARPTPADAMGDSRARAAREAGINPNGFTSARTCGTCHIDIYNTWKNSLHAFSLTDPVFDTAYMQAIKEGGDAARKLCLRCHAPLTLVNGDYDLKEGVTRDGVSCDFCHSITAVHLDEPTTPFSLEVGPTKRSVLRNASSPVHEVVYSELHKSADLCGGCHNYPLADGTLIMGTYEEWKRGPYARNGVQCQSCHMASSAGKVVSPDVKATEGNQFHLHNLIHDTDQLRSALTVNLLKAVRVPDGLLVEVLVENVGSGHMVPTGIPSREIVLTVTVQAGGKADSQERRYRKVVADKDGQILTRDFEMLLLGAKIVADNRIAPHEQRIERLSFPTPGPGTVKVNATLSYVYSPMVLDQREINIELAATERFVS